MALVARAFQRRTRAPGGRRRAPVHADRRLRHEHRHRGRRQPRLEARRDGAGLGRRATCSILRDRAAADRRSATPAPRASSTSTSADFGRCRDDRGRTHREGEAARRGVGAHLSTRFGEEFASIGVQLGARYDGSPIVVADGAPPPDNFDELHAERRAGRPRAALWLDARAAAWATRSTTGSARASRCCGSAASAGRPASIEAAARPARYAAHAARYPRRCPRTLRPRPRADPPRPARRLARQRAAADPDSGVIGRLIGADLVPHSKFAKPRSAFPANFGIKGTLAKI